MPYCMMIHNVHTYITEQITLWSFCETDMSDISHWMFWCVSLTFLVTSLHIDYMKDHDNLVMYTLLCCKNIYFYYAHVAQFIHHHARGKCSWSTLVGFQSSSSWISGHEICLHARLESIYMLMNLILHTQYQWQITFINVHSSLSAIRSCLLSKSGNHDLFMYHQIKLLVWWIAHCSQLLILLPANYSFIQYSQSVMAFAETMCITILMR